MESIVRIPLTPQQYEDIRTGRVYWIIIENQNVAINQRLHLVAPFGGGDQDLFAVVTSVRWSSPLMGTAYFRLENMPQQTSDDGWHPMPVGNRAYLVEYTPRMTGYDPAPEIRTASFIDGHWHVHGVEGGVDVLRWKSIEP